MHIVLLGDSIFDNKVYVGNDPDVRTQLEACLPEGGRATLLAIDGNTTDGVPKQADRIPQDATHLVLSVGGNDALGKMHLLTDRAESVSEVILRLAHIQQEFENAYQQALQTVLRQQCPTAICTLYYPRYPDTLTQTLIKAALSIYNDCVLRVAIEYQLPVLDLRYICDQAEDFANPIEPSAKGGAKIAMAIARLANQHDFDNGRTNIYT